MATDLSSMLLLRSVIRGAMTRSQLERVLRLMPNGEPRLVGSYWNCGATYVASFDLLRSTSWRPRYVMVAHHGPSVGFSATATSPTITFAYVKEVQPPAPGLSVVRDVPGPVRSAIVAQFILAAGIHLVEPCTAHRDCRKNTALSFECGARTNAPRLTEPQIARLTSEDQARLASVTAARMDSDTDAWLGLQSSGNGVRRRSSSHRWSTRSPPRIPVTSWSTPTVVAPGTLVLERAWREGPRWGWLFTLDEEGREGPIGLWSDGIARWLDIRQAAGIAKRLGLALDVRAPFDARPFSLLDE